MDLVPLSAFSKKTTGNLFFLFFNMHESCMILLFTVFNSAHHVQSRQHTSTSKPPKAHVSYLYLPRTSRSRRQQSNSSSLSLSLSQLATPRQTLSFSAASTPIDNTRNIQESIRTSEVSQVPSAYEQSLLRQRKVVTTTHTTTVDGQWGQLMLQIKSSCFVVTVIFFWVS